MIKPNIYRLIFRNKNLKDNQIPILKREKAMTEELLSSLYLDLKEDVISKEEYQLFRKNYTHCYE